MDGDRNIVRLRRFAATGRKGTSLAIGSFPRARMISSPASTRARSCDRVVFAVWIVTMAMTLTLGLRGHNRLVTRPFTRRKSDTGAVPQVP